MTQNKRQIEFTLEERVNGDNVFDMGSYGTFRSEYVEPDARQIYGWWDASEKAISNMEDLYESYIVVDPPFWSIMRYIPDEQEEEKEQKLKKDPNAKASDFMKLSWVNWYVRPQFSSKGEKKGGEGNG